MLVFVPMSTYYEPNVAASARNSNTATPSILMSIRALTQRHVCPDQDAAQYRARMYEGRRGQIYRPIIFLRKCSKQISYEKRKRL